MAWDPAHKGQWWLDGHPPQRLGVASGAQLQGETLAATAGLHAQFDGRRHKGGGEVASSGFSPRWGCCRVLCSRPGEEEAERVLASWFGSGSWTSFRARTSSHDLSGSASGPVWHPLGSTLAPPWWRSQCRGRQGTVDAASGGDGDGAPSFAGDVAAPPGRGHHRRLHWLLASFSLHGPRRRWRRCGQRPRANG